MRIIGLAIVVVLMILLDLYVFQVLKSVAQGFSSRTKSIIYISFWVVSAAAVVLILTLPFMHFHSRPGGARLRNYVFATIMALFFAKLFASVFFLLDDIRRLMQWGSGKLFFRDTEGETISEGITRSTFLSWLGLGIGASLFTTLVHGFANKYHYEIRRIKLAYDNLPGSFRGLKIVQISDIHSGSFSNKEAVAKGVQMILDEKPDLILFTGDIVNDLAIEMKDYMDVFNRLKAPMGVYSTLGNHDYADYYYGANPVGDQAIEKAANLEHVKRIHGELGWRLLLNEHVALQRGGEEIALIGIENWSAKKAFSRYGKMSAAYPGSEKYPFKILMSHDPSHWDAEVRPKYSDIDLTLSGHTHGMQFGVEIAGFHWSPVQYVYNQWAGLYEEGKQKLYVNRGYGFIGYPGRVGILPEITVIELA